MTDLYSALGVPKTADAAEIKRAYRKLTQELHPDKNPGNAAAEERYKRVTSAYDVLGDPERRKLYDEFGEMSLTQGFDPERARAYQQARAYAGGGRGPHFGGFGQYEGGGFPGGDPRTMNFDDLLSQLFGGGRVSDLGGGRAGRGAVPRRGRDLTTDIAVSLIDSLLGVTVPLRIEASDGSSVRTIDVKVPAGIEDGKTLRLREKGGAGSPPGDLLLTVRVRPSTRLNRDGDHLRLVLPVTALEAYRGGPIEVPTPWGPVTLKLPAGSQNGQVLRLRGKGVTLKDRQGDLLVQLEVQLPKQVGDAPLVEALERLQGDEDPRRGLVL